MRVQCGCDPFIGQYRAQQAVAPLTVGVHMIADATFVAHSELIPGHWVVSGVGFSLCSAENSIQHFRRVLARARIKRQRGGCPVVADHGHKSVQVIEIDVFGVLYAAGNAAESRDGGGTPVRKP